jgi:hypothetical protein
MTAAEDLRKLYLKFRLTGKRVDPRTAAIAIRAVGDYAGIRSKYVTEIQSTMSDYLLGAIETTAAKGQFKRAVGTAFLDSFETGWIDTQGKGATYDPDPEDSDWLATRLEQELSFVDSLFVTMRDMRNDTEEPITEDEIANFASNRASMYGVTLDGIYGQGRLRSRKNVMLTLEGPDGKESCRTCQKYKGQSHRAKWWIAHDLIPAPGNSNYDCGGWQCQHILTDPSGNQWAGVVD